MNQREINRYEKSRREKNRFILWRWFDRKDVVQMMEMFQDLIVMLLGISLLCTMAIKLWNIFSNLLFYSIDFRRITADILFLLILVELFRLLVVYLEEHSISVGVAVEISIVSVLREVIVHGALETNWVQILSICGLLLILGALLMVCARTPHMDHFSYSPPSHALPHSHEEDSSRSKAAMEDTPL